MIRHPRFTLELGNIARRASRTPSRYHSAAQAKAKIALIDAKKGVAPALVDRFEREHDYLRISLTERCNLRCFYCMPEEGVELSSSGHILTNDEVVRLARLFVKSGVTKIRLTGGEPTIRKGISDIIRELNQLRPYGLRSIALTSNGIILHRQLEQFVQDGLTHLNISLDTLDPLKFEVMTRRRGHAAVLRTLGLALNSPSPLSVKLNAVIIKGLNDAEVLDFVALTKENDLSVRFIEFMPFAGNKWDKSKMVPSSELLSRISRQHPDLARAPDELNDTARSWKIPGHKGSFGFISSMSDHFCASCNRLRITADGQIKVCLFDAKEVSLRDQMRGGASDEDLLETIGRAVFNKKEKHAGMEDIDVLTNRPMILIGGSIASYRRRHVRTSLRRPVASQLRYYGTGAKLTHLDDEGRPSMVDVCSKEPSRREATATGRIYIPPVAYDLITTTRQDDNGIKSPNYEKARSKGDALTVAQLAAIMGCKKTPDLIPLCHPLALSHISVALLPQPPGQARNNDGLVSRPHRQPHRHSVLCTATVSCEGKTGVEMEALTAVSVGLLTVWDMLKAVAGKEMEIGEIVVTKKSGGKSGDFARNL
ncbi:MoaC family protein [Pleurotus pulmonarius]